MTTDRLLYELPTNVVVSAGAGTGKTHRLTGLYLHLVAGLTDLGRAVPPDAIVATTFTREAASEMRARIESRLRLLVEHELGDLHDHPSAAAWARELSQTCTRRSVSAPAREVWRGALDRLPRGTITTFHAWAGDLVRAYPLEARVPPSFTLIEPEESDELVLSALSDVLGAWVDDDSIVAATSLGKRAAARAFLASGLDRLEEAVLRASMRTAEDGLDIATMPLADDDGAVQVARARRGNLLSTLEQAFEGKRVDAAIRDALAELRAVAASLPEDDRYDEQRVERFGALVKQLHVALGRGAEAQAVKRVLDDISLGGLSIAEAAGRVLDDPSAGRAAIALGAASRVLLSEVAQRVESEKRRTRALDFGDVMRKARDLLLQHPDVQAEVVESVSALLVDEFQDTNALQRDLVYLVWQAPEAIARRRPGERPEASTLRPRGLFLVGDRKQSIYGFRGADVAVFQQMAVELAGDQARDALGLAASAVTTSSPGRGRLVTLDENRRSVAEILRFVNAVARVDMKGHEHLGPVQQVVFQPAAEDLKPVRSSGLPVSDECLRVVVPIITLPELPENDAPDEVSRDLAASLAVAAELRKLLDDPATHHMAGEPRLRARDVAILIQTYAVLPSLELALSCHGIEYAVAARRGLYRTVEAGDLEAFVRLAIEPDDRNALLAVLRGPYVTLSDTALLALTTDRGLALPSEVPLNLSLRDDERARLHRLREALEFVRTHEPRLGVEKALARALDHLGVERTLALLPRGEQRIGDLRRLIEISGGCPSGLVGFGRHLARARASATSVAQARKVDDARGAVFDRDDDVVRIMTVHASKGLEFRVVVVMQLEHQGKSGESAPILVERRGESLAIAARVERGSRGFYAEGGRRLAAQAKAAARAERQRLTYVALTRARDLLWVVAGPISGRFQDHTAAASIHHRIDDPAVARREVWHPTVSSPLPPSRAGGDDVVTAAPVPAFGEGPFPVTTKGSVVVTTALADFAACPRRFRLLHLVGLGEQPPHVPELPILGGAGGQLALFGEAPPVVEVERDLARDAGLAEQREGASIAGASDDGAARLPVAPPPIDPRVQGVVAHLALERAPLDAAPRDDDRARAAWAKAYATTFLRGEGYDPDAEPGRVLVDRIGRFLASGYAGSLGAGVDVRREHPFLVTLPSGIALRGTIDLLVVRPGASGRSRIEIVDYKLRAGKGGDVAKHALQLRAYAAAVSLSATDATELRAEMRPEVVAGIAFLGAGDGQPIWLDDGRDLAGEGSVALIDDVARRLLAARASNVWPAVARSRCDAIACGFRPLCHPRARKDAPARRPT
jgi:ATP-dependent helicase/nuclease subunit A